MAWTVSKNALGVELVPSDTVNVIVALQFQRNVIRPALGALHKTAIESGHGSWGIYTKKLIPAGRAEVACQTPILRY